jgi:HTH-type transcriptional regulator/antitoxin HigA
MKATLIIVENDAEHAQAKALVEKLMTSSAPQDRARMTAQTRLVEAYERARWPRTRPALPDLLIYLVDQHGLSRADLVPALGTAGRVSEVLNGKRELSMTMVKNLRERFHISANHLISQTSSKHAAVAAE